MALPKFSALPAGVFQLQAKQRRKTAEHMAKGGASDYAG
jgi:hypothetical protein